MKISPEKLAAEAQATGFRPDVLEKVAHLLGLLDAMRSHPFLKGKLVLEGGTALNLFVFDVPRLSVDIDLNYVGAEDRDGMLAERPKVEQAVQAVFAREGFTVRRMPEEHAGGKWSLRYENAPGRSGNLEVDINFMFRVPLWPVTTRDSHSVGTWRATGIPVLDHHELVAGKLAALLARRQARDLFDSHRIDSPNEQPRFPPPSHRVRGLRRDEQEGLEDGLLGRCGLRRHGFGQAVGPYAARQCGRGPSGISRIRDASCKGMP